MKRHEQVITGLILIQLLVFPSLYWVKKHTKLVPRVEKPKRVNLAATTLIGNEAELLGARNAEFTLVEFGDYQCPPCAYHNSQIKALLEEYPSKLRFRFHHFPLQMHTEAMRCALVGEMARATGQFWKVHNALYALNTRVSSQQVAEMLHKLNVDEAHLSQVQIASAKKRVEEDVKLADASNVDATPTFFLCVPTGQVYKLSDLSQINAYVQ